MRIGKIIDIDQREILAEDTAWAHGDAIERPAREPEPIERPEPAIAGT